MLQNYLRIVLRNVRKNAFYVLVNVIGMGIALACCIIAFVNYQFDRDFDAFHSKRDTVFKLDSRKTSNDLIYGITPLPLAAAAKQNIPEVEDAVRLYTLRSNVKSNQNVYNEVIHFVDDGFFEMFDFPITKGSALDIGKPESIILTEKMAIKYFGDEDPIGKTIEMFAGLESQKAMTVIALVGEYPFNSSIHFDMIAHTDNITFRGAPINHQDWSRFADVTFLKLKDAKDKARVEEQLAQFVPIQNSNREDWEISAFLLDPLSDIAHTAMKKRTNYLRESTPPSAVWGPSLLAFLLLLAACLNLTNTTIALSNRRLKEMGVRKVMGSSRKQLMTQLLGESFGICLLAFVLSLFLVPVLLPQYNAMWDFLELEITYFNNPALMAFLVGSLLTATLLAGAYPAFYISGFEVTKIFRGKVQFSGNNLFSRVMLGAQVMIAIMALAGGFVFARNASFQKTADMGYLREGVMAVPVLDGQSYEILKEKAAQHPDVIELAGASGQVGNIYQTKEVKWRDQDLEVHYLGTGEGYLDMMEINLKEGRFLTEERGSDTERSIMVNEKLVANLGWQDPLNQQIMIDSNAYQVVGVVEDFYQGDFFNPIEPVIIQMIPKENYHLLALKAPSEKLVAINQYLLNQWNELFPYRPYEGFFQDQVLAKEALITNNIKWLFIFFAVITVVLTSVGLFALISLNIVRRMKEIAIRRVVGATLQNITVLLNFRYFLISILGVLVGAAGGYFIVKGLLDSIFAVHVGVEPWVLGLAGLGVLFLVMLTILLKMIGVVQMNPSKILRSE
ncbi:MAG: ABC transporter permease [Saprospiraceae bacterium]|nr:ABC transporter permease [Saprospiraceae bacterium]